MSGIWPDDVQCVVSLSFDVDGVTSWTSGPEWALPERPGIMTMGEYGPKTGAPRILRLLDEYHIKASFFVPGYVAETHAQLVEDIISSGHEVGHHGYKHEPPAEITLEKEREVLEKGIEVLKRLTGHRPKGYRSPAWDLSANSGPLLAEHGFLYDSSLMDDDAPYIWKTDRGDLVELPIHELLDDFPHFGFDPFLQFRGPMCSPTSVYKTWIAEFDGLYKEGRCYILTLHPQIIGQPGRILGLERTIQYIISHPNVKFMRAVDIAEYWMKSRVEI